jgi:hypothetical protein
MNNQDNLALGVVIIIVIIICFMFSLGTSKYDKCYKKPEKFELDPSFNEFAICDRYNNANICIANEDRCFFCKNEKNCIMKNCERCVPKSFDKANCGEAITYDDYYSFYPPTSIPFIYDLYMSTKNNFDWQDWFENNDFFPPFVYHSGRYYLNIGVLPYNETIWDKYHYLMHTGVPSINVNKYIQLFTHKKQIPQDEFDMTLDYFFNLENVGRKIFANITINNKTNWPILDTLGKSLGFPYHK